MRTSEDDWQRHVYAQLAYARARYPLVFVVGLSTGGLLALEAATTLAVDGIGVLSPTFTYVWMEHTVDACPLAVWD